jgi:hypothetical protein
VVVGITAVALGSTLIGTADSGVPRLQPPKLSTGAGPISVQGNLFPGQKRRSHFSIENPNGQAADLWLTGALTGGDKALYDILYATISTEAGLQMWSGPLWELASARNAGIWNALQTQNLTFDLEVASWAGNTFQAKRSEYSLGFSFLNNAVDGDTEAPNSKILTVKPPTKKRNLKKGKWLIKGTATDNASKVSEVRLALIRLVKKTGKRKSRCTNWVPNRRKLVPTDRQCTSSWFRASGHEKWNYLFPVKRLPKGSYILISRAIDSSGNIETAFSKKRGNRVAFKFFKVKR